MPCVVSLQLCVCRAWRARLHGERLERTTFTSVIICPAVGTPSVASCVCAVPEIVSEELQSIVQAAAEFCTRSRAGGQRRAICGRGGAGGRKATGGRGAGAGAPARPPTRL